MLHCGAQVIAEILGERLVCEVHARTCAKELSNRMCQVAVLNCAKFGIVSSAVAFCQGRRWGAASRRQETYSYVLGFNLLHVVSP